MNFKEAKQNLLNFVNRPAGEIVGGAGSTETMDDIAGIEINNAILWANRTWPFKYAERICTVTYVGGSQFMKFPVFSDNKFFSLRTVDLVTGTSDIFGTPLVIRSFSDLQSERMEWANNRESGSAYRDDSIDDNQTTASHASWVARNYSHWAFLLGESLGLYPVPTNDVFIMLHANILLNPLFDDSDTNFMLEFGADFIISKALKRMSVYLKDDIRIQVTNDLVSEDWASFKEWDEQIKFSRPIDIR